MHTPSDLPLNPPFRSSPVPQEALVQDRPTLGAMPLTRRGAGWWLLPGVDFAVYASDGDLAKERTLVAMRNRVRVETGKANDLGVLKQGEGVRER